MCKRKMSSDDNQDQAEFTQQLLLEFKINEMLRRLSDKELSQLIDEIEVALPIIERGDLITGLCFLARLTSMRRDIDER